MALIRLETKYFGEIECREDDVIAFPGGLPGFETEREFVTIHPNNEGPLVYVQSSRTPGLCFLTLPTRAIAPDYRLSVTSEDLAVLRLPADRQPVIEREVACLAVLSVASTGVTANLLAPLVIRTDLRMGVQAVRIDQEYSCSHPLELGGEAC